MATQSSTGLLRSASSWRKRRLAPKPELQRHRSRARRFVRGDLWQLSGGSPKRSRSQADAPLVPHAAWLYRPARPPASRRVKNRTLCDGRHSRAFRLCYGGNGHVAERLRDGVQSRSPWFKSRHGLQISSRKPQPRHPCFRPLSIARKKRLGSGTIPLMKRYGCRMQCIRRHGESGAEFASISPRATTGFARKMAAIAATYRCP
jgi:hypothetical protein